MGPERTVKIGGFYATESQIRAAVKELDDPQDFPRLAKLVHADSAIYGVQLFGDACKTTVSADGFNVLTSKGEIYWYPDATQMREFWKEVTR